ncbi:hypothetical protein J2Y38_003192 [Flavobacterium sp. 2755]|nr:hypothetical protein [Flavobacterium sp. 2755]
MNNRFIYKILSLIFALFFIYCMVQFVSTNAFEIRYFRGYVDVKLVAIRILILSVSLFGASLFFFIDRQKNK